MNNFVFQCGERKEGIWRQQWRDNKDYMLSFHSHNSGARYYVIIPKYVSNHLCCFLPMNLRVYFLLSHFLSPRIIQVVCGYNRYRIKTSFSSEL